MKRKLTAVLHTLFFITIVIASPLFMEWYAVDVLHKTDEVKTIPFFVWVLSLLLFFWQVALSFYLWVRFFDDKTKQL